MVMAVFRSRLRPEHVDEFDELASSMLALAESMPGFGSYKSFISEDGERCSVIEFESLAQLEAWRDHPEHGEAQRVGRDKFYQEYTLHVLEPVREARFVR